MSVAVIGASGLVGAAVVRAVCARDPLVKALVRRPEAADPLRRAGARVAVGDDERSLLAVLGGSETVCYLAGGANEPDPGSYEEGSFSLFERVVSCAPDAGARRVLLLSALGANHEDPHPFLRAKGKAERLLGGAPVEHAVVRCAPIYGLGGFWFAATVILAEQDPPLVVGDRDRPVAPVFVDDVASVFAVLDDRAALPGTMFGLSGPTIVAAGELAARIAGRDDVREIDSEGARAELGRLLDRAVSSHAVALLTRTVDADPGLHDPRRALGITPTTLDEGLERIASLAADRGR